MKIHNDYMNVIIMQYEKKKKTFTENNHMLHTHYCYLFNFFFFLYILLIQRTLFLRINIIHYLTVIWNYSRQTSQSMNQWYVDKMQMTSREYRNTVWTTSVGLYKNSNDYEQTRLVELEKRLNDTLCAPYKFVKQKQPIIESNNMYLRFSWLRDRLNHTIFVLTRTHGLKTSGPYT